MNTIPCTGYMGFVLKRGNNMLKKRYKAILFDMDGTLLPMDMEEFTKGYFKKLYKEVMHFGIGAEEFTKAIWTGTYAMMKNDGKDTNRNVFWKVFEKETGLKADDVDPVCLSFYSNAFDTAVEFTTPNPLARKAVEIAHSKSEKVILSTNPIFPMAGQITRMKWLGLAPSDFDLVTAYEDEHFCKPNPMYFISIMERFGLKPEECLVIGNDEREDMYCATKAGIDCYLVTDSMIANKDYPWDGDRGTFEELVDILSNLEQTVN